MNRKPHVRRALLGVGLLSAMPLLHAGAPNVITVTTTADTLDAFDQQCSLREAVHNARLNTQFSPVVGECPAGSAVAADVIMLTGGQTYALTLAGGGDDAGDLDLAHVVSLPVDVRIAANGATPATIQQQVAGQRVMEIHGVSAELENLIVTGGAVDGAGGGILNTGGHLHLRRVNVFGNSANAGGGIYSTGTLTAIDSEFQLNSATLVGGGAIFNEGGNVSLRTTLVRANSGPSGGGLYQSDGNAELTGVTMNLNQATSGSGGAVEKLGGSLTISGSTFDGNTVLAGGGGGAVNASSGPLFVRYSTFTANGSSGGLGGGAINGGTAYVRGSTFIDNSAAGGGGAIYAARLWLKDSLLQDNAAGIGGGIFISIEAELTRTRFIDNAATSSGGGAYLAGNAGKTIASSLFSGNHALGQGGGLWLAGGVTIANTTLTGNGANSGGGGMYIAANADVTALNITLLGHLNGQDLHKFGNLTLGNSIISTPGQPDCTMALDNPTIISLGHNIADDDSCFGLTEPGDMIDTNPMVDTFADHGGNTMTWSLLPGSPALDTGDSALCAGVDVGGLDQRGGVRPTGGGCDIGAHEQGATLDRIFADGLEFF